MKKLCFISGLAGGTLLIAVLAIQPRPQPTAADPSAADSSAVVTADLTSAPSLAGTSTSSPANELIPNAVAVRAPIETSAAQKLIDVIREAVRSGDVADWERISQEELPQLIKSDPQAAADLAQTLEPGFIREQMLRQVAHGWTAQDSTAALAWASRLADAGDRDSS